MNFPDVVAGDPASLAKVQAARRAGKLHLDGHAPGLSGKGLSAYLAAGVRSDHECTTYEEALEKRRLGMWIMIREGSAARHLEALLPLVKRFGPGNCLLCTDDREPDQLLREGHINDVMRKAVALGCPPYHAVVMGTLFAARYHRLHDHGAVAPGFVADIVAVADLEHFRPMVVWKRGRMVAMEGRAVDIPKVTAPDWMRGSVRVRTLTAEDFDIRADGRVRVIGGGQIAVAGGKVLAEVPCPIGGLLSDRPAEEVAGAVEQMEAASHDLGARIAAPFMTMSFMALSVIPELKITDRGLVDTVRFELVPLEA